MSKIYRDWGFTDNPFQTTALKADEQGEALLIGRAAELDKLTRRLLNPPKLATLEGANGVGKTSLVNVAVYKQFKSFLNTGAGDLLIPCRKSFQLSEAVKLEDFTNEVMVEVAQTLLERAALLKKHKEPLPDAAKIAAWLNAPQNSDWQFNFGVPKFGIGGGRGSDANTSSGFEQSGFKKIVQTWLEQIYPNGDGGGVVCILDNLELLQTTEAARALLEQLRDLLFTIPGLRWVLCGATGIMHSVAASPRLDGFLHAPIEIPGLAQDSIDDVYKSRITAFSIELANASLPITPGDFDRLYTILNKNLRSLLSYADNYCMWVSERSIPLDDDEKQRLFGRWLTEESGKILEASKSQLGGRAWEVFDKAVTMGGTFSPSDFAEFGCTNPQALRPQVKDLEEVHLLTSLREETDKRRKTIQVTPKGFLVAYARNTANSTGQPG